MLEHEQALIYHKITTNQNITITYFAIIPSFFESRTRQSSDSPWQVLTKKMKFNKLANKQQSQSGTSY